VLKAWEDELGEYMDKEDPIMASVTPGPPMNKSNRKAKGKRKKTGTRLRSNSTESEHTREHAAFCRRLVCQWHNKE
jgi:hypothetical protein